jgi:hypothetical protein
VRAASTIFFSFRVFNFLHMDLLTWLVAGCVLLSLQGLE